MDMRLYWVWLQCALGIHAPLQELCSAFPSPYTLYQADDTARHLAGVCSTRQIRALRETSLAQAQQILDLCEKNGWQIITPDMPQYPPLLLSLRDMPAALYVQGDIWKLHNKLHIAVVGTRSASYGSLRIASRLCASLARAEAVVISGGALGVDAAAHEGVLRAGGVTAAVLGCGLGTDYLQANHALRESIAKTGALISEYPPFTQAAPRNFPIRNRIISGMCHGTVVIEAGERSGSLITANLALEQGRDVFAVPGDIISSAYTGANKLIREGAKPVFSAYDILEEYAFLHPDLVDMSKAERSLDANPGARETVATAVKKSTARQKAVKTAPAKHTQHAQTVPPPRIPAKPDAPSGCSDEAQKVWTAFDKEPLRIDELALLSALPVQSVMAALTELELCGTLTLHPGKRYFYA